MLIIFGKRWVMFRPCCLCWKLVDLRDLMRDGWGDTWDVCKPCALNEARTAGARVPCPTCQLRGGFHDRDLHAERVAIPADKLIVKEIT